MVEVGALAARVQALGVGSDHRVIIGIAGAPGAGKTTLAVRLVRLLAGADDWRGSAAAHVPMDGFHLADRELDRLGLRDRKGAPETFDADGYAALLERVRSSHRAYAPVFERDLEQPIAGALPVVPTTRFVVSEGNYLLLADGAWPRVRNCFNEVWFVRTDETLRQERLIARHVEFGKTPERARWWVDTVDDPNARLVAATAERADLILDL